jgi:hypothetical protein
MTGEGLSTAEVLTPNRAEISSAAARSPVLAQEGVH